MAKYDQNEWKSTFSVTTARFLAKYPDCSSPSGLKRFPATQKYKLSVFSPKNTLFVVRWTLQMSQTRGVWGSAGVKIRSKMVKNSIFANRPQIGFRCREIDFRASRGSIRPCYGAWCPPVCPETGQDLPTHHAQIHIKSTKIAISRPPVG